MLLNRQSTFGPLQRERAPSYSAAHWELIPASLEDATSAGTARAVNVLKFPAVPGWSGVGKSGAV